jgi:hypothetical protein
MKSDPKCLPAGAGGLPPGQVAGFVLVDIQAAFDAHEAQAAFFDDQADHAVVAGGGQGFSDHFNLIEAQRMHAQGWGYFDWVAWV